MAYSTRLLRSPIGFALCAGLLTAAAAHGESTALRVGGTLWEEQVRAQLRREIAEREQALWQAAKPLPVEAAADPLPQPPAPPAADSPQRRTPPLRDSPRVDGAPLRGKGAVREGGGTPLPTLEEALAQALAGSSFPARSASAPASRTPSTAPTRPQTVAATPPVPRARQAPPSPTARPAPAVSAPPPTAAPQPSPAAAGDLREVARELAAAALLVAVGLVVRRRLRGDLNVHVVYPLELRGSFCVRIDTTLARAKRRRPRSDLEILEGGNASSRIHPVVARETSFRQLRRRRYYVTIDGVLQDPRDESVVAHPFLQGAATVVRRRTVRLDLDATPGACPVDVRVVWDGVEVADALVAARGHTGGSVETLLGHVRLNLPRGSYTVVAGAIDRVVERPLQVDSHLPTQLEIDLAAREGTVFKACPPAVAPYLAGQLETAAQQLTRDGQPEQGHRLLGQRAREHGRNEEAALHFEAAGALDQAAEIQAELRNYTHAGELFERSHDLISAAEMYQLAGDEGRAGRAYEAARDFDNAIACYRSAGDVASWVDILDRHGNVFDAACVALENELATRGVRLLHRVSPEDPHYHSACILLADTFERESHYDLAARKLTDHIEASDLEAIEPGVYARLADLHEKAGDVESALDVLESLRMLEPAYPNLAARTEELRKARSAQRLLDSNQLVSDEPMTPTVVLAKQRYEQLEEIGRGGMGVVYKARDRRLGRVVALKRLSESLREHPRAAELFLREARAAAALNHPNIVTVYDADLEEDTLFITMELLDGNPLHRILRQRGPMEIEEITRIGRHVCAGLAYAHMRGVIHRDIKTANLFLTTDRRTKIMDFGLARIAEEVRRSTSLIGGTPNYMAPEQVEGAGGDHRADLYALGATLFELTTGEVPSAEGSHSAADRPRIAPDPREIAAATDPRLAHLIGELLAVDPADRPDSAETVGLRLAAIHSDTPVP